MPKSNPAPPPLRVSGDYILANKDQRRGLPDEFVRLGLWLWSDQSQNGCAIRRGNAHPPFATLETNIESQCESQLVQIEPQALFLIANKNVDRVYAEVSALPVRQKL